VPCGKKESLTQKHRKYFFRLTFLIAGSETFWGGSLLLLATPVESDPPGSCEETIEGRDILNQEKDRGTK